MSYSEIITQNGQKRVVLVSNNQNAAAASRVYVCVISARTVWCTRGARWLNVVCVYDYDDDLIERLRLNEWRHYDDDYAGSWPCIVSATDL